MNSIRLFVVRFILKLIPDTRAFGFKRSLFRWAGAIIGDHVKISSSAIITGVGRLTIGNNTWIGPETMIVCSEEIVIGSNCNIAPRVYLGDGTHLITPTMDNIADTDVTKPIHIGDGCWLCVNSTILPGVSIKDKCVVAAGAVVNKNYGEKKLLAGVPAKAIKDLE